MCFHGRPFYLDKKQFTFSDVAKSKIPGEKKEYLKSLNVVSLNESSSWLIDYWCGKNIRGLLQMPFSRHWIMHVEACEKVKGKLHLKK